MVGVRVKPMQRVSSRSPEGSLPPAARSAGMAGAALCTHFMLLLLLY